MRRLATWDRGRRDIYSSAYQQDTERVIRHTSWAQLGTPWTCPQGVHAVVAGQMPFIEESDRPQIKIAVDGHRRYTRQTRHMR